VPDYKTIVIDLTTPKALIVKPEATRIEINSRGMRGLSGASFQNVFIQQTQPTAQGPYLWIDNSGGNLNFWVEEGE